MKKYKYCITWNDNTQSVVEIETTSILDGHYQIYRDYAGGYKHSCYVK